MLLERKPGAEVPRANSSNIVGVRAYSMLLRALSQALPALALVNISYIAVHLVLDVIHGTRSAPPLAVAFGVLLFSGVPVFAAMLLRRAARATVAFGGDEIVLTVGATQYKIPITSVAEVRALKFPFPGPGVALIMKSGAPFRYRLELPDPIAFLSALPIPSAAAVAAHPAIAFGRERALLVRRGPLYLILKYCIFPLVFAIIVFRLHQYIVFGGPFGQYRMFGLAAYLKSFVVEWVGWAGRLVVYGCVVRFTAELIALPLTWAVPSRARAFRRAVEIVCVVCYFVVVPAFVAFLLLR